MRPLGWVLVLWDWCPKKRRLGHRDAQKEREVRAEREDHHPQAEEKPQQKPNHLTAGSWTRRLQHAEQVRFCCSKPLTLLCFAVAPLLARTPTQGPQSWNGASAISTEALRAVPNPCPSQR